jgi:nicotinate-nucleotide adenylyltransferase
MERPPRIGLYGGTFDPVHVGHVAVASGLSTIFELDDVLFIPAFVAPHKRESRVTPALHRYAMLALATQDESALRVSMIELNAPERPYTVDTLSRMRDSLGEDAELFFIMGADSWSEITSWRDSERLLELSNHIVVTRPGYDWDTGHVAPAIRQRVVDLRGHDETRARHEIGRNQGPGIYLTDVVNLEISATAIRRAVREGRDAEWRSLVTPPVADYIEKYQLYGEA